MNENIDLTKILKDCPKGWKFYTPVWGEVSFDHIYDDGIYIIGIVTERGYKFLTKEGCYLDREDAECIFFPSKDQRDWSKFTAPWYKKDKFDPKTLQPFDKILMRDHSTDEWDIGYFSYIKYDLSGFDLSDCEEEGEFLVYTAGGPNYWYAVPYNDDTKHLIGTTDEAPEYYRYWEDCI